MRKQGYIDPDKSYSFSKLNFNATELTEAKGYHLYKFRNIDKEVYNVKIYEYENKIFMLKYHLAKHEQSNRKYQILINSSKSYKTIATVLAIFLSFIKEKGSGSYGFIGERTEVSKNQYKERNSIDSTQKYNVYKTICNNFFPIEKYVHFYQKDISFYIVIDKREDIEFVKNELLHLIDIEYLEPLRS